MTTFTSTIEAYKEVYTVALAIKISILSLKYISCIYHPMQFKKNQVKI